MDKRCTVCNHSQTHEINLTLLAGATLDTLKQQFGLSRSALHRHKHHLQRTIAQAEDRLRNNFLLSYLFQFNDYNAAAAATVAAARDEGNARLRFRPQLYAKRSAAGRKAGQMRDRCGTNPASFKKSE